MKSVSLRSFVSAVLFGLLSLGALSAGCSSAPAPVQDAGAEEPIVDAGGGDEDAGTGGEDAGGDSDAGSDQDAGTSDDAGLPDGGGLDGGGLDGGGLDGGEDAGSEDAGAPDAGGVDAGGLPCDGGMPIAAQATWYDGTGAVGNCSVDLDFPNYAAVSPQLWAASAACGTCFEVTGPDGVTEVVVADQCPSCALQGIDLSPGAFAAIANPMVGITAVTLRAVPCTTAQTANVEYRVQQGTNPYYLSVVVWGGRYPVASLEVHDATSTTFQALQRQSYNAFTSTFGAALVPPLTMRATDVYGHSITGTVSSVSPGTYVSGAQFPLTCAP